jgi:hypothetical protein
MNEEKKHREKLLEDLKADAVAGIIQEEYKTTTKKIQPLLDALESSKILDQESFLIPIDI